MKKPALGGLVVAAAGVSARLTSSFGVVSGYQKKRRLPFDLRW